MLVDCRLIFCYLGSIYEFLILSLVWVFLVGCRVVGVLVCELVVVEGVVELGKFGVMGDVGFLILL